MTLDELRARWEQRRADGEQLGAMVRLDTIAANVLRDLRELELAGEDVLTVRESAALGGYSEDHLRREIAAGHIANAGRRGKPALLRRDVPRKPGHIATLPATTGDGQLSPRRRIVREASLTPNRST